MRNSPRPWADPGWVAEAGGWLAVEMERLDRLAAEAAAWPPALEATGRLPGIDRATWLSADEMAALAADRLVAAAGPGRARSLRGVTDGTSALCRAAQPGPPPRQETDGGCTS